MSTSIMQRLEVTQRKLGVCEELHEKMLSMPDAFTDDECDNILRLKSALEDELQKVKRDVMHHDTVTSVQVEDTRRRIRMREGILNACSPWVELFDIFREEHERLLTQQAEQAQNV